MFETEIHNTIIDNALFKRGDKVAIAASGGKGEFCFVCANLPLHVALDSLWFCGFRVFCDFCERGKEIVGKEVWERLCGKGGVSKLVFHVLEGMPGSEWACGKESVGKKVWERKFGKESVGKKVWEREFEKG